MEKSQSIDNLPHHHPEQTRSYALLKSVALLTVVLGYAAVYYSQSVRLHYWSILLLPDIVWAYWTGSGEATISDRFAIWLTVGWYFAGAYATGRLALQFLHLHNLSLIDRHVLATSVGLILVSNFTLAVGLAGGLHLHWLFRALITFLLILAIVAKLADRRSAREVRLTSSSAADQQNATAAIRFDRLAFGCLFVALTAMYLVASTIPSTEFDALEYHLQVPKEWFQARHVSFLPHNLYGNMPLGAEMHVLACMELWVGDDAWWYGALAGKCVIALVAPLTALALYSAGARFYSRAAGAIAAVVYLTLPWIGHVSFTGLIDGVLAHYMFVATYAAVLAGGHWRGQLLAGLLAGGAAACKYPGLVFAAVPVLTVLAFTALNLSPQRRRRQLFASFACAVAGLAAACGLWYAKNAVLTGNPIYPLGGHSLNYATRSPAEIQQWERAHRVPGFSAAQLTATATQVAWRSHWLSPIYWPLVVIGVIATRHSRETRLLWGATLWIFAVWFFATHRIDRFWLPAAPLAALLAGAAWQWSSTRLYRRILTALVVIGALGALSMFIAPLSVKGKPTFVLSNPNWLTSLERLRSEAGHPAHRQLNAVIQPGEAVLLVGDAQPFNLRMPVYYNTCFDRCIFEQITRDRSASEIRESLAKRGIAYVLVDWGQIRRYRLPGNYGFTEYIQPELFRKLVRAGVLLPPKWYDQQLGTPHWEIYPVRQNPGTAKQ